MALYHAYSEVENSNTGVPMSGVRVVPVFQGTGGPGLGAAAPIFINQAGDAFTPANYCITDSTGMYSFYIDAGTYDLDFFIGSKFIRRISDCQFIDPISTNVDEPYRATLTEAITEFPIGFYFKSDDQDSEGPHPLEMWFYQRTGLFPFYVALASNTASLTEINDAVDETAELVAQAEIAASNAGIAATTAPQVYPTTGAGLAAVADGASFWVAVTGVDVLTLYRRNGAVADLILTMRSVGATVPLVVQTYGNRGAIPIGERYAGLTVFVVEDQRWFDLAAGDLTNTGWKTPSWLRPLGEGTISERNNRVGGYPGWPKRGFRFLQTDVFPYVEWEYRLTGDPSGDVSGSTPLGANAWVKIGSPVSLRIDGFRVEALTADAEPVTAASWAVSGITPTSQVLSWGSSSIALAGSIRYFQPKDWAASKPFFVVGNSLSDITDLMISQTRWSQLLAANRGVDLYSVARYSSDWRMVYRSGVVPLYLTVADNTLPAGGTPKSVTLINGKAPSNNPDSTAGNPASFLNTGDAGLITGVSMPGTIVDGANTRHVTVSIPNAASTAYSIVSDIGSPSLALTGAVLFIPDIAKQMATSDVILWVGNNFFYSGQPGEFGDHVNFEMHRDMAKLVAGAQGNRVLILPVIPGTTNALGSEVYNALLAANARTESLYPNLYARSTDGRDLLKYLQDHGDGSANDNSDIANGWTPRSLRVPGDPLHLNAAGDAVTADFVDEALNRQAIPDPVTPDTIFTLTATGTNTRTGEVVNDLAVSGVAVAPAAYLPAIVSDTEPTVSSAALWFKTTPGSTIATLWVKDAD